MTLKGKKVLITCGPTWVPIDRVRVISNMSTGSLGHLIARGLINQKANVTLIEGPVTDRFSHPKIRLIKFKFFNELENRLKNELKKSYAAVIHCAAVSDYRLKDSVREKIRSGLKRLKIELTPTPKLIESIKRLNPRIFLVGFKLETGKNLQTLKNRMTPLLEQAGCDLVVANCLKDNHYRGWIFDRDQRLLGQGQSRPEIASKLINVLKQKL